MTATASPAAPRRARDRRLCARQEQRAGRRQGLQAVVERDAARAEPEGDRGLQRRRRASRGLSGRLGDGAARGDRPRVRARSRPHRLRRRLRRSAQPAGARLSRATATRRSTPRTASWSIRSRRSAPARRRWSRRRRTYTADVDAILARGDADAPRSCSSPIPNNPTGTYVPFDEVKRLHAGLPPHVLLVLDAAYAEYVRRNDYEAGIELVATSENVVMTPHVLEDPRPRGAAARLDVRPGACGRCASTASAGRSTSTRRRSRPASPRSRTPRIRSARASTTTNWLAWLTEEIGKLGLKVTPSVGEFRADPFPGRPKAAPPRTPTRS